MRCKGITKNNTQCKNKSDGKSKYCKIHHRKKVKKGGSKNNKLKEKIKEIYLQFQEYDNMFENDPELRHDEEIEDIRNNLESELESLIIQYQKLKGDKNKSINKTLNEIIN